MAKDNSEQIKTFVEACHKIVVHDLLRYSAGNLSWRGDDGLVAVSASRAWLGEISEQQVAICTLADGNCINGKTPSVESGFHFGVLRSRPDTNLVLHALSRHVNVRPAVAQCVRGRDVASGVHYRDTDLLCRRP